MKAIILALTCLVALAVGEVTDEQRKQTAKAIVFRSDYVDSLPTRGAPIQIEVIETTPTDVICTVHQRGGQPIAVIKVDAAGRMWKKLKDGKWETLK